MNLHDEHAGHRVVPPRTLSRRDLIGRGATALAVYAWLSGCGTSSQITALPSSLPGSIDELVAAARTDGALNTISLPPDFANFAAIMHSYETRYGIRVVRGSPNASSGEQLQAIKALQGIDRAPDVIDVGPPFAYQAVDEGLTARYKVATWNTIPGNFKDPDGGWVGDYWGAIAFGANTRIAPEVPKTWHDLLASRYKGMVALDGDPRESGSAFAAVFAAALATGGSLDKITPGIDFFAEMKKAGTLIHVNASPATALQGETPIMISWDYGLMALADQFNGKTGWEVNIPGDGVFGNFYCQAINRTAPHPSAARLWQEFLYSDEGQLMWLEGYAHPVRFDEMHARGAIPEHLLKRLPPHSSYESITFPTAEQTRAAKSIVQEQWASKVSL